MSEKDPTLEVWRESIAAAIGCETTDIKTVKELLECNPVGACETHGRCWTHSEWQKCGSLIQSVSSDPCEAVVDGLDGLCSGCRAFKVMCEQHDNWMSTHRPSAVDRRRLDDGARALEVSAEVPANLAEARERLEIVSAGLAAIQSLDDLGPDLNERAHRDEQELWRRYDVLKKRIAELEAEEL